MAFYKSLDGRPLKSYLQVEIREENGSKHVIFHSTIHVNKQRKLTFCFSKDFTDAEILKDYSVIKKAWELYGNPYSCVCYE